MTNDIKNNKTGEIMKKRENYLNNRDLLRNIHLSKASYTWYEDGNFRKTKFLDYDFIACGEDVYRECREQLMLQVVNRALIKKRKKRVSVLKEAHYELITEEDYKEIDNKIVVFDHTITEQLVNKMKLGHHNRLLYEEGKKRVPELPEDVDYDLSELVLRVYTFEHIPQLEKYNPNKVKRVADLKHKVNFPPYKHYVIRNGKFECVAISHMDKDGQFSTTHGEINQNLAMGFLKISERNVQNHNWRGYSYSDEMQGNALVQLTMIGLMFNELFSANPFAYYTTIVNNAFTVILNQEKDVQNYRDKTLIDSGQDPSSTQQYDDEFRRIKHWNDILKNGNMEPSEVKHIKFDD